MLHNYFIAAIRNLMRNRAYAAINLCGLALGFAAAILIALYVRDEYSYDRFYPDHDRIYRVMFTFTMPGQAPLRIAVTSSNIAEAMRLDFSQVEAATRLSGNWLVLRRGKEESSVLVQWADPNFFEFFPVKTLYGDGAGALRRPDGLVLTRSMARRLFGRDNAVGEAVSVNPKSDGTKKNLMRVAAVIEDLPSNTHLNAEIFAAGVASFSLLSTLDAQSTDPNQLRPENTYTYVRLRPGTRAADLDQQMSGFAARHLPAEVGGVPIAKSYRFSLVPLAEIHLAPRSVADMKPPGDTRTLQAMTGIAVLILIIAGSNFVSMMTARAARRAVEVGVRKAVGATRRQIVVQFLGECLFYSGIALALAIAAVTLVLPALNGFLQRGLAFDMVRDPVLGAGVLAGWLIVSLAAGAYPALVLSRFRPGAVLKGIVFLPGGSGRWRQALVIFQFGTLIALIVATLTIYRQMQFAIEDRLRLPEEQVFIGTAGCRTEFRDAAARLPGVKAVSCTSGSALTFDRFGTGFEGSNGAMISFRAAPIDYGMLELFDVKPVAGRLFSPDRGEDDLLHVDPKSAANPSIVVNESGARALGYATPEAAIGQSRRWARMVPHAGSGTLAPAQNSSIIGVIPDFSVGSVRDVIEPMAYYVDPNMMMFAVYRLDGRTIPETMRELRELWARQSQNGPFEGLFLNQYINDLYADIRRQSALFSLFAGVAVVIAALGLLGLAVFTAERRTREIGLRKVMGASRLDILRFLGWQFTRPVLWANLLAWPLAWFAMRRWLEGFAYHVNLSPAVFVAASVLAVVIALATVAGHALLVARARPSEALRYE